MAKSNTQLRIRALYSEMIKDGSMTLLEAIQQDMELGLGAKRIMEKRELSWQQLRMAQDLINAADVIKLRKHRVALVALENAEEMTEQLADNHKYMKPKDLSGAIKTMVDVSNQLSGGPSQVIEIRHNAVTPDSHNGELETLRSHHRRIANGEVIEAELVEHCSTNVDDY